MGDTLVYFIAVLDFFTGSLPTWMIERVRDGYWQVPGGGGPQSRDIPRHLPESIHRQASQRSCTSQRLGRLLLSPPRICQVSPSGTSLSFLPRARHHISHPLNPPERHFFHQIPSPPLSPTSHFPTINLSTFEQPTDTNPPHLSSPSQTRPSPLHPQPPTTSPSSFDTLKMPGPNSNLPAGSETPQGRSVTQASTPASSGRDRATIEIVDRYLNGHNGHGNSQLSTVPFPHPPLLSHSQGIFGQDTLTCPYSPDPDANQSPFRLAGGAGTRARWPEGRRSQQRPDSLGEGHAAGRPADAGAQ